MRSVKWVRTTPDYSRQCAVVTELKGRSQNGPEFSVADAHGSAIGNGASDDPRKPTNDAWTDRPSEWRAHHMDTAAHTVWL